MRLILIRHGEYDHALRNVIAGRASCRGLSERGFKQAERLAHRFGAAGEVFEHDVARILAYSRGAERSRLAAVIAASEPGIRASCTNLPAHYLHGDCSGSNFLIDGDNTAIIDLDHLHWGPRIYDLAYFLTDQVKWNTEATRTTTAWLKYFPHVLRGYEQITPLSQQEKDAIWSMMLAIHLLVTDYLIQHQNYKLVDLHLAAIFWLYDHQRHEDKVA